MQIKFIISYLLLLSILSGCTGGEDYTPPEDIPTITINEVGLSYQIVETWNEEMGVYQNIVIPVNTKEDKIIELLKYFRNNSKNTNYQISVFDDVSVAYKYFDKLSKASTKEEEEISSHILAYYIKSPGKGYEAINVRRDNKWVKLEE